MDHEDNIASLHPLLESVAVLLGGKPPRFHPQETTWTLGTAAGDPVQIQASPRAVLVCLTVPGPCSEHLHRSLLEVSTDPGAAYIPALTPDGELAVLWDAPPSALEPTLLAQEIEAMGSAARGWLARAQQAAALESGPTGRTGTPRSDNCENR